MPAHLLLTSAVAVAVGEGTPVAEADILAVGASTLQPTLANTIKLNLARLKTPRCHGLGVFVGMI